MTKKPLLPNEDYKPMLCACTFVEFSFFPHSTQRLPPAIRRGCCKCCSSLHLRSWHSTIAFASSSSPTLPTSPHPSWPSGLQGSAPCPCQSRRSSTFCKRGRRAQSTSFGSVTCRMPLPASACGYTHIWRNCAIGLRLWHVFITLNTACLGTGSPIVSPF